MLADNWQQNLSVKIVVDKGNSVFANNDITAGMIIGYLEGYEISYNTKHSMHLDGEIIEATGMLRYLSHSCDPNAFFKNDQRWLYALKDIKKGNEITIDYERTEPVISAPFLCLCGSPNCRRAIGDPSRLR
jgi:SET domain-containing protein